MKKYFLIHPFFFALIPILSLYNNNKDLLNLQDLFLPILASLLLALAVFFIVWLISKNVYKTSLVTSFFLIWFFLFRVFNVCFKNTLSLFNYNPYSSLDYYLTLALFLFVSFLVFLLVFTSKSLFKNLNKYLFLLGVFLCFFSVFNIFYYHVSYKPINLEEKGQEITTSLKENEVKKTEGNYPDIYYLIFDDHARTDILEKYYDYSNQDFIAYLENKGFFVAKNSQANYPQTYLSMSSALNLTYLDSIAKQAGKNSSNREPLINALRENKVYNILDDYGYVFVASPGTWTGARNLPFDVKLKAGKNLSDFNRILLQQTPVKIILKTSYVVDVFKNNVLNTFEAIPDIANIKQPTFNYTHLLSPHPPFLFDKNGNLKKCPELVGRDGSHYFEITGLSKESYRQDYVDQLYFIDQKIKQLVENILAQYPKDSQQPIIIIQSDHGPGMMTDWGSLEKTNLQERLSILNAYYVPNNIKIELYDYITPVNSFRLIFKHIFNQDMEILEDKSYFATWDKPFDLVNVTEDLK